MKREAILLLILSGALLAGGAWFTWSLVSPQAQPDPADSGGSTDPFRVSTREPTEEPPAVVVADRRKVPDAANPGDAPGVGAPTPPMEEPDPSEWLARLRLSGRVMADGGPVQGARVTMQPSPRTIAGTEFVVGSAEPRQVVTMANGTFEFPAQWVDCQLRVEAQGFGWLIHDVRLQATDVPVRTVVLELSHAQSIAGRVLGADGQALQGAQVTAFMSAQELSCSAQGTADADGYFLLDHLVPGDYQLLVNAGGYVQGRRDDVPSGTQDLELMLGALAKVRGRVLNAQTGAPVPSFTVFLARPVEGGTPRRIPGRHGAVHANGSFELTGLDPGTWVLEVQAPDLSPAWSQPFTTREGDVLDGLLIAMGVGGVVRGRVVDPAGQALVSTEVLLSNQPVRSGAIAGSQRAMDEARGNLRRARTDETGGFRFDRVPVGTHHLVVRHPVFQDLRVEEILVQEGQDTDLGSLALRQGAVVQGVARDDRGRILVGATIQAVSRSGGSHRTVTDGRGAYRLTGLAEGDWQVGILQYASTTGESVNQKLVKAQRSMVAITLATGQTLEQDVKLGGG